MSNEDCKYIDGDTFICRKNTVSSDNSVNAQSTNAVSSSSSTMMDSSMTNICEQFEWFTSKDPDIGKRHRTRMNLDMNSCEAVYYPKSGVFENWQDSTEQDQKHKVCMKEFSWYDENMQMENNKFPSNGCMRREYLPSSYQKVAQETKETKETKIFENDSTTKTQSIEQSAINNQDTVKDNIQKKQETQETQETQDTQIGNSSQYTYHPGGFVCLIEEGTHGCLLKNRAFSDVDDAVKHCSKTNGCKYVMKYNDKFYLRRQSDSIDKENVYENAEHIVL